MEIRTSKSLENQTIKISRFDPYLGSRVEEYSLSLPSGSTVLDCLLYIRDQIDSTLAFRYGCRFKSCGLCTLEVNVSRRLACLTRVNSGIGIAPLKNLPLLRDLVIDRKPILDLLKEHELFLNDGSLKESIQDERLLRLLGCTECLSCISTCPKYGAKGFGGPFVFVRLAQLSLDPRNHRDRRKKAQELGITECQDCGKCICLSGISIYKDVIESLLYK